MTDTRTVPLNKLVESPRNVRRTTSDTLIEQLAADIEARGLLQNLVVMPAAEHKGCFEVLAGGRRLKALQRLAGQRKLPKTHPVDVRVFEGDDADASEASLSENFQRLAMNPADECQAFQRLIDLGADVAGIARRFGLTTRFVEGRLRLADLAEVVFIALAEDRITLDVAKAFASIADRERQAQVFAEVSTGWNGFNADTVRRLMRHATVAGTDRRALLVGEAAYLAAGGRIERDLFADDATEQWLDVAILERLACERMEEAARAAAAATGLGWIKPSLDAHVAYGEREQLHVVRAPAVVLSDEEQVRVDDLSGKLEELEENLGEFMDGADEDPSDDPDYRDMEAKAEALRSELEAIVDREPEIDPNLKAEIGTFLLLGADGVPKLVTERFSERPIENLTVTPYRPSGSTPRAASQANKAAGLSQALVEELAVQRRDVLAIHVASDPGLALDLAIFTMVDRRARLGMGNPGSTIRAETGAIPVGVKAGPSASREAMHEIEGGLDTAWTEHGSIAARFDAFRAMPDDARAAWLAHCVASSLNPSVAVSGERACPFHDHLGTTIGVDVAKWWRPTAANYFDRVSKATMIDMLREVGGKEMAARFDGLKKAELAQTCERLCSGNFIAEVGVKEAALAWVPPAMRFNPGVAEAETTTDEADDGDIDDGPTEDDSDCVDDADTPDNDNHERNTEAA